MTMRDRHFCPLFLTAHRTLKVRVALVLITSTSPGSRLSARRWKRVWRMAGAAPGAVAMGAEYLKRFDWGLAARIRRTTQLQVEGVDVQV